MPEHVELPGTLREVHVLIPYEVRDGREVSPEYDTPGFRAQLRRWFDVLNLSWTWHPVTLGDARAVVAGIRRLPDGSATVLNLCDGNEVDGYPGLTVTRALEESGIAFTGADSHFYSNTNSKLRMKDLLSAGGVPTPGYECIADAACDVPRAGARLGYPLIAKPVFSAACFGICHGSVVHDDASAMAQVARLRSGLHGCRFAEVFLEHFVIGREFTVLVTGAADRHDGIRVYPPAERAFDQGLPPELRFLTYERYWEQYDEEAPLPGGVPLYRYAQVPAELGERLAEVSRNAYTALGGTGYARVDLRLETATDAIHVIEVNANCGLSDDGLTSVSWILRLSGVPFTTFLAALLADAWRRRRP